MVEIKYRKKVCHMIFYYLYVILIDKFMKNKKMNKYKGLLNNTLNR